MTQDKKEETYEELKEYKKRARYMLFKLHKESEDKDRMILYQSNQIATLKKEVKK